MLGGILWVARTGCSGREMPEDYGDFTTAYERWRLWKERGLWGVSLRSSATKNCPDRRPKTVTDAVGPE